MARALGILLVSLFDTDMILRKHMIVSIYQSDHKTNNSYQRLRGLVKINVDV